MKNFKTGILSLALVLGVSGAVISKIHAAPKRDVNLYNWTRESSHTPVTGEAYPFNGKSVSEAQDNFGCDGQTILCATGTDPNGVLPQEKIYEPEN